MTSDGLISTPEGLLESGSRRTLAGAVILLFALCTVGTGTVDRLAPLPAPKLLGIEKYDDAHRRASVSFIDGSRAQLLEHDLRVTSRVRRFFGQPYTLALFLWLEEAQSTRAVVGRDHTIFLGSRLYPSSGLPPETLSGSAASLLVALERSLHQRGVQIVAAPIPRKAAVSAHLLPGDVDAMPHLDRLFVDELRRRGVPTADLLAAWADAGSAELFFGPGTHWTQLAEVLAAEEVARVAGFLVPEAERASRIRSSGFQPPETDLLHFIGLGFEGAIDSLPQTPVPTYDLYIGREPGWIYKPEQPQRMPRLALAGTSFSALRKFPDFLAHFAQDHVRNLARPAVDTMEPVRDLLRESLESGERLPEVLVLEIPNHLMFRWPMFPALGEVFAENPPAGVTVLQDVALGAADGPGVRSTPRKIALDEHAVALTATHFGTLHHGGDGSIALRLRGRVEGGEAEIALHSRRLRLVAPWAEGVTELVLPFVNSLPGSISCALHASARDGSPVLTLEAVELVVPVAPEGALEAAVGVAAKVGSRAPAQPAGSEQAADPTWSQRLDFGAPTLPDQCILVVELAGRAWFDDELWIEVKTCEGGSLTTRAGSIHGGGHVVVSLSVLAGETLEGVAIRGPRRELAAAGRIFVPTARDGRRARTR